MEGRCSIIDYFLWCKWEKNTLMVANLRTSSLTSDSQNSHLSQQNVAPCWRTDAPRCCAVQQYISTGSTRADLKSEWTVNHTSCAEEGPARWEVIHHRGSTSSWTSVCRHQTAAECRWMNVCQMCLSVGGGGWMYRATRFLGTFLWFPGIASPKPSRKNLDAKKCAAESRLQILNLSALQWPATPAPENRAL